MCGIAGIFSPYDAVKSDLRFYLTSIIEPIAHRGPDDFGFWSDPATGIGLAHRRLSIIDISQSGHQPMRSPSGRYWISFNGEIYNHKQLRNELVSEGRPLHWLGNSDTETLLACIDYWGLEHTLLKCSGMWSIALFDTFTLRLHLVRDRIGEKPLYYGLVGTGQHKALIFASELSSIRAYPHFSNSISRESFSDYLQLGNVPSSKSIYNDIFKLLPGHLLTIDLSSQSLSLPQPTSWWSLCKTIAQSDHSTISDPVSALHSLHSHLSSSVLQQCAADVPLGAFLSGGIDSSLVVSLMQEQSSSPINTFTIGFEEDEFDEAPFSRRIAQHLGTNHHEFKLSSSDALSIIPKLSTIYSEPFSDSSQIPTFLVCQQARQSGLTVALTGDGGDELFAGYNRHILTHFYWRHLSKIPHSLRRALSGSFLSLPHRFHDSLSSITRLPISKISRNLQRLQSITNYHELYSSILLQDYIDSPLVSSVHSNPLEYETSSTSCLSSSVHPTILLTIKDSLGYLPNDILVKVDRAAMAVSLETRCPFLDHKVVDFAFRLSPSLKLRQSSGKWLLRQLLYQYVPKALVDRPKAGFAIPLASWLRGPLVPWASHLLEPTRISRQGFLNPSVVSRLWAMHQSGTHDFSSHLWSILMWQAWLENWA